MENCRSLSVCEVMLALPALFLHTWCSSLLSNVYIPKLLLDLSSAPLSFVSLARFVPLFAKRRCFRERRKGKSSRACLTTNQRIAMPKRPLILCVDDEWNGLEGRKMLLEESGCKVLASTSGAEALRLFASNPVDLVLLDYHMPEMRGDVVAACMKASHPRDSNRAAVRR